MPLRKGRTIDAVFTGLRVLAESWDQKTAAMITTLGRTVGADVLVNAVWHDARRAKESIAGMQSIIDTLGSTPAEARQALRTYAEQQYGGSYNILAETVAFRDLLTALQQSVETLLPVDGNGFVTAPYIRLADTGPFLSQFTAAETAPVRTALQAIRDHIAD